MSKDKAGALAIFVKTPGLSSIKTRLAESIGKDAAEQFHLLAARAIESVASREAIAEPAAFVPYWAVAEKEGLTASPWRSFQTIWQGDGGLGERLSRTYDELIRQHPFVIFVGADSPQFPSSILTRTATLLSRAAAPEFVLGRADDGGFYLFGGSAPVPRNVWLDVPYSSATTAQALAESLRRLGRLTELPHLFDVDTVEDMNRLAASPATETDFTPEQRKLMTWVRGYFGERK